MFLIRPATTADIPQITTLWHTGWHEAHAPLVPAALTALRTIESMRERTGEHLARTIVAADGETVQGFVMIRDRELYQLYTSPTARGTGVAAELIAAGERGLAASGAARAVLSCAIGNTRAARFYEKSGWHLARTETDHLDTAEGSFALDTWRFEKDLLSGS